MTYSQFGEDISAKHALRKVRNGFYVDVGAYHPFQLSNTALMHLEGWDGINVEPRLESIRAFEQHRPRALNLRAAIHNDLDRVELHKFQGGKVDTVVPARATSMAAKMASRGRETVPAMSLNRLFEDYVPAGTTVNYLSVDIEGYDTDAVVAFDLGRHRPEVVCVELHRFDVGTMSSDPMVCHLIEGGYHLYAINVLSFTFVRRDAASRLGLWQVPALPEEPPVTMT